MATEVYESSRVEDRYAWWREAKFGMFIHWGLYAIPAGVWKGQQIEGIGEWIMHRARIPVREYEQLAKQFNPVKFDADAWVKVAKDAGMKYIVITSKHHDGFCMFGTKASKYNIVDATPFGRDPIKELAEACRREGLRLCFYYSQDQDWYEPDASGNDWDFDPKEKNFARYFETKVKPQVRELLTQYGPIGLIWFDTPISIAESQSRELVDFVHQLQPDCLVNSRVGNDAGDYVSEGDNRIPICVNENPWETPATINDTWGFKTHDHNWKSAKTLIRLLIDIVSKGGNYLLNVGPTAEGEIPEPSIERLRAMGEWLRVHGEAIYGASPSPFPSEQEWGAITRKPGKLYLHVFDWPKNELVLYGLKNRVRRAYLLGDPSREIRVVQSREDILDLDCLRLADLPEQPYDENASVIVLEIDEPVDADRLPIQHPSGRIVLGTYQAHLNRATENSTLRIAGITPDRSLPPRQAAGATGAAEGWVDARDSMSWTFKVHRPGTFDVEVLTVLSRRGVWENGHEVTMEVAGQSLEFTVNEDGRIQSTRSPHQWFIQSKAGRFSIPSAGIYTLALKPRKINAQEGVGFSLCSVNLLPR